MAPGTRLELSAPVRLMRFGNKRREQTRCLTGRSGAAWQAEDTVGLRSSQLPQAIKPFTASAFLSCGERKLRFVELLRAEIGRTVHGAIVPRRTGIGLLQIHGQHRVALSVPANCTSKLSL